MPVIVNLLGMIKGVLLGADTYSRLEAYFTWSREKRTSGLIDILIQNVQDQEPGVFFV